MLRKKKIYKYNILTWMASFLKIFQTFFYVLDTKAPREYKISINYMKINIKISHTKNFKTKKLKNL